VVDARFERGGEREQRHLVGRRAPGRRHHARAQLANDFLGDRGVLRGSVGVERRQRETAGFAALAVAARAVLLTSAVCGFCAVACPSANTQTLRVQIPDNAIQRFMLLRV